MKKYLYSPLLAALSILLCAFSVVPVPELESDLSLVMEYTTAIETDESGVMKYEVIFSHDLITLFRALPETDMDQFCDEFLDDFDTDWEKNEIEDEDAFTCVTKASFEDLSDLKSLMNRNFSEVDFDRLEIKDGKLYYDLMPKVDGSSLQESFTSELRIDFKAYWILEVPGDVVSSNADERDGRTLKWNFLNLTPSSHIIAETKIGGLFGLDTIWIVLGVICMLSCCCLVILLLAGGVVFFFLRRKK